VLLDDDGRPPATELKHDEDDIEALGEWKAAVDTAVTSGKMPPVDD
jgi:hypothetical protein